MFDLSCRFIRRSRIREGGSLAEGGCSHSFDEKSYKSVYSMIPAYNFKLECWGISVLE
jgi:hypothetical protein